MKPFIFKKAEQTRSDTDQAAITELALSDFAAISGGTVRQGTTVTHNPSTGWTCSGPDEISDENVDTISA